MKPAAASIWRHNPHGATGSAASLAMASRRNLWCPATTADTSAVRSAQKHAPYEAFSTLHPANTVPSSASSAAPTWKFE